MLYAQPMMLLLAHANLPEPQLDKRLWSLTSRLVPQVLWWKSGLIPPLGVYPYWTDPFSLFFIEIIAIQFAELKRCGRETDLCELSRGT